MKRHLVALALASVLLSVSTADGAGSTFIVSVASDGTEANGASQAIAISADGRFVAFETLASNLGPGDTNNLPDIYVNDGLSGITERVSPAGSGAHTGTFNAASITIGLSGDGRYVAFESLAASMPGDMNAWGDVFVYDRQMDTMELVSVSTTGVQGFDGHSWAPAISADGRVVAFLSLASNLVPDDYTYQDVFVHDRETGVTEKLANTIPCCGSGEVSISGDGRFVTYLASDYTIQVYDREKDQATSVVPGGSPVISTDGNSVSFASFASNLVPGDTNGLTDVFVYNRTSTAITRVSVDSGVETDGGDYGSDFPTISADGRYVAFESDATNLDGVDTNVCPVPVTPGPCPDIFVHDRQTGVTTRVSESSSGAQANNLSGYRPSISGDGGSAAFLSNASNLIGDDENGVTDAFVHDLGDGDSDGKWDPFDPCPGIADEAAADSDGDEKPDACDAPGTGNVDCSGPVSGVNSVDALKVLRHNAGLSVSQNEPCLDIGLLLPSGYAMGDVNCSGTVNAVDALLILRANAGLSVNIPQGCPAIKPP